VCAENRPGHKAVQGKTAEPDSLNAAPRKTIIFDSFASSSRINIKRGSGALIKNKVRIFP
jgi:hypothetical protein